MRCRASIGLLCVLIFSQNLRGSGPADSTEAPASSLATKPIARFVGPTAPVTSVAFTADGRQILAACSQDVRRWDIETGEESIVVKELVGPVVVLAADARRIACAAQFRLSRSSDITIYDAATGNPFLKFDPHGDWNREFAFRPAAGSLALSPDGTRLAIGASRAEVGGPHGYPGGVVTIWNADSGKQLQRFTLSTFVRRVAFSEDGRYLAAGTNGAGGELPESGEVHVWSVDSGEEVRRFRTRSNTKPGGSPSAVASLVFSPDAKRVAAAVHGARPGRPAGRIPSGEAPADVLVWDLATGDIALQLRGAPSWSRRLAFRPDGKLLATADAFDPVVQLWNADTGEQIKSFRSAVAMIGTIEFSPDGRQLAVAGGDADDSGAIEILQLDD
ncbi:MAG: WD40 repeat domain-containing protein [Pirellulales bacterium]